MQLRSRIALLLPGLVVALLYWPALQFGYIWDDQLILVKAPQFHTDWPTLLSHICKPFLIGLGYFRPLPLFTLGAEQLLFGGSPFVPHLDALILHAANSCLVAVLGNIVAQAFGESAKRALFTGVAAGLLYGIHPALLESAVWVSVRFDTLMTFFALLALLADRRIESTGIRAATVALLFLAAALSKEMAVGWALLLPMWHSMFLARNRSLRELARSHFVANNVTVYAAVFAAGIGYLVLRATLQGQILQPADYGVTLGTTEHLALIFKTFGKYLLLTAWPFAHAGHLHYLAGPAVFSDRQVLLGVGALVAFCASLWFALRRGPSWLAALPCCFVLSLVPVLNIVPLQLGDNFAQDRFLALPMTFAAIWAAMALTSLFAPHPRTRIRALAGAMVALLWIALSALVVRAMMPGWRDNLTFSATEHAREPSSISGELDLQQAYLQAGKFREARDLSEQMRALQNGRLYPPQQIGYAYALAQMGELEQGLREMEQALAALEPTAQDAEWRQLGDVLIGELYLKSGAPDAAAEHLRRALAQQDSADTRYFLALAEMAAGHQAEGDKLMDEAIAAAPRQFRAARLEQVGPRLQEYRTAVAQRGAAPLQR